MKWLKTIILLTFVSVCFGGKLNIQWETIDIIVPVDTVTVVVDTTYDETNWDDDYNLLNEFGRNVYDAVLYESKQHVTNWYIHEEARIIRVLFYDSKK